MKPLFRIIVLIIAAPVYLIVWLMTLVWDFLSLPSDWYYEAKKQIRQEQYQKMIEEIKNNLK